MQTIFQKTALFFVSLSFIITGCVHEKPVTEQEAVAFGKTLEQSVADKNADVFDNSIDPGALEQHIKDASQNKIPDNVLKEVPATLKKRSLGEQIIQSSINGSYAMVRNYEKDGKQHLLFRLYGPNGLNYHDIELTHSGGKVKISDMYIYLSGENLSKTLADIAVQLDDKFSNSAIKELSDSTNRLRNYVQHGRYEEAFQVYKNLPEPVRKEKAFQIINLQVQEKLSDSSYKKALEEFSQLFPDDPAMYLLSIDVDFLHKDYNAVLTDLNKLDTLVKKDPFLDYYRGLVYKQMNNDSTAYVYMARLYHNMPQFTEGLLELISLSAARKETDKVRELITAYKKDKNFKQQVLDYILMLHPDLEK